MPFERGITIRTKHDLSGNSMSYVIEDHLVEWQNGCLAKSINKNKNKKRCDTYSVKSN